MSEGENPVAIATANHAASMDLISSCSSTRERPAHSSPTRTTSVESLLSAIARQYPEALVGAQQRDVRRIAFNIRLVTTRVGKDVSICDVGGGIGLFSVGCAALGMKSTLVDDFGDNVNRDFAQVPKVVHAAYAVSVVSADVVERPPSFQDGSFDVVTSFDSMEHWHHSPRALFHRVVKWLRPGGLFVLGVPNCVNLRKRITVPFGIGKWSSMEDWYEEPRFRQHVREPDVADLRYIARDLHLQDVEIVGRNWLGYDSKRAWVRFGTQLLDSPLRLFPSLCADIYLLGRTPG